MSFFFRPAFYPECPIYSSYRPAVLYDEAYYRHPERRKDANFKLPPQRLYHEEPHFRSEYGPDYFPTRSHYAHGPFDIPFDAYESQLPPRYENLPNVSRCSSSPALRSHEQAIRDSHKRQIEEWVQRRRQRELEEAEFRRSKELERRRDDEREFDEELDSSSTAPRQVPTHSQTYESSRHISSPQPVQASVPASTPSTSPSLDFASQLWNALSGGRSNEERANILRDLGLDVPFNVTLAPKTRGPAAEQLNAALRHQDRPLLSHRRSRPGQPPAPLPIPVIDHSAAPTTPQPKPSTSRNPSPAPVKQSPFAQIESIQTKFDSLRASTPDLSDHQKKHEYLAELNKLLTSLDAVESSGSESIRGARKALVRAVEDELEEIEGSQDVEKHEADEDQHTEEPKEEASAEPVAEEVEIKSVSESNPTQLHSIEPAIEEPTDVTTLPLSTEPEPSSKPASTEGETQPSVPATIPDIILPASQANAKPEVDAGDEEVHGASQDTEEQPGRGCQSAIASQDSKFPKTQRPPSVEIEEVPDEESLSGSPWVGYKDL
ncbi:hypothetical protein FRC04_004801 [Tulasnella sp. 424]|nr:hypothetical protein FRC04_004801 [Tulasnella sp. 424]KAG8964988.1 hypothetical protein FRC05_003515 [Tulasnella sp. 425]